MTIEEVERLDREATPGPWEIEREELDAEFSDEEQAHAWPQWVGPIEVGGHDAERADHPGGVALIEADVALVAACRNYAPALVAEVRRLRAQIGEGMACGIRSPRDEQPRTVRTRWRVSGKIVSTLDEYEVEAADKVDAQHKAEADADNFAEWEEGPEIEEIDEDWNPLSDPSDEDQT